MKDRISFEEMKDQFEKIAEVMGKTFRTNWIELHDEKEFISYRQPVLSFIDSDEVNHDICNVNSIEEALKRIERILDKSDYQRKGYTRMFEVNSEKGLFEKGDAPKFYKIDYGSHTSFFAVRNLQEIN